MNTNAIKKNSKNSVALLLLIGLAFCQPSNPKDPNFKLKRYREIGNLESLISSSVTIVNQINSNAVSQIFKAKYRKDLSRLDKRIEDKFASLLTIQKKVATKFNEKNLNLYQGKKQNFNNKVQLGLSVENTLYKSSYLNNLIGHQINVTGRVLNTKSVFRTGQLIMRIPFEESVLKTKKILIIYVEAETKSLATIQSLRRFQDIETRISVTNAAITESENFVVVDITGVIVQDPQIIGWLGLRVWSAEPSLLPAPQKFGALNDRKLAAQAARVAAYLKAKANKNKSKVNISGELKATKKDTIRKSTTTVRTTKKDNNYGDDDDEPDDF